MYVSLLKNVAFLTVFSILYSLAIAKSIVDPFWLISDMELVGTLYENTPLVDPSKSSSKKRASTKPERTQRLKSAFQPICEIAAQTVGATDSVVNSLGKLLDGLKVKPSPVARQKSDAASLELVGNPKVQTKQKQKRNQPSATGAPTTKASQVAARKSKREKKASRKAKEAVAAGRNTGGQRNWG